jgi:hypothetical protein
MCTKTISIEMSAHVDRLVDICRRRFWPTFNKSTPVNAIELANQIGIDVHAGEIPFPGKYLRPNERKDRTNKPLILYWPELTEIRMNTVIAHEIGHAMVDIYSLELSGECDEEDFANSFGAKILGMNLEDFLCIMWPE